MATYILPTFNLTCNVFTGGITTSPPRISGLVCNLAWGKRVNVPSTGGTGIVGVPLMTMVLLAPSGSDIRDRVSVGGPDAVEVPSGSGRFYDVAYCDNIGMGFTNEHRAAVLQKKPPFKTPDT